MLPSAPPTRKGAISGALWLFRSFSSKNLLRRQRFEGDVGMRRRRDVVRLRVVCRAFSLVWCRALAIVRRSRDSMNRAHRTSQASPRPRWSRSLIKSLRRDGGPALTGSAMAGGASMPATIRREVGFDRGEDG
jgi:hypothetical protein